ncbi:hypothetical protein [Enterococcus casseliflavus]|uniref:hypothetical protein n=1 Tax=Enterococcus casseliflavus TaxID=37734 RepID=UPI00129CEAFB|nr:hypothetical protein [Enterococcus casseliflavus]
MKLADTVTGVEYWCVTERFTKPFKAVCVKVLENSAIVTFGSDRTVVRLRDMKRVE